MVSTKITSSEASSIIPSQTQEGNETQHRGHKFCCSKSVSPKIVFAILLIIGVSMLIIGVLAIAGYSGAQAGICQKLNSAFVKIATKLGATKPAASLGIAILTTCVGLGLTLIDGSLLAPHGSKKAKEIPSIV